MRTQPRLLVVLIASVVLFAIGVAACVEQWQRTEAAEHEWQSISQPHRTAGRPTTQAALPQQIALPPFNSAELVTALHRAAEESKLPLDEILFSLDDNATQPYLRYHATLTVSARYPAIRSFLQKMRTAVSNVSLDSITCTREDIGVTDLTCELALSAFYKKEGHG